MTRAVTLFIVEGENRDYRFVEEMTKCFMRGRHEITVISVPAAQNAYMLYEKLKEDDFDTDVVEVLRECVPAAQKQLEGISRRDVAEVYLFFDFDPHQDNLPQESPGALEAMERMLQVFDNETDQGKLYISYPMVEALYDYRPGQCQAYSRCFISKNILGKYKHLAGEGNPISCVHMGFQEWKDAIEIFALRVRCLLDLENMDYITYREIVTPRTIYEAERRLGASEQCVFVLSAFPEFLLDYFDQSFWNSRVKLTRFKFGKCEKVDSA